MKSIVFVSILLAGALSHAASLTPLAQTVSTSYGDSITAGFGTTPELDYAGLLATDAGAALHDYAISGQTSCSMADTQVFFHPAPSHSTGSRYITMMIGTNDSNLEPVGAYESIFNMCHLASLTWLGVPRTSKALAQNSDCVKTGKWAVDQAHPDTGLFSTTQGDAMTCTLATSGGPLYLWHRVSDNDGGTFTYAIDHGPVVTVTTATAVQIATTNGGGGGAALVRIPDLAAGQHIVDIQVTSPTAPTNSVLIYGIGTPPSGRQNKAPRIFAAGVPFQLNDASSAKIAQYNSDAIANIEAVASDGIAITFVDVRKFWLGQASDMMDLLHPNPQGHLEIKNAFEVAITQQQ